MAANRFATMLRRKTNNLTLVLVYAILEWILIVLLLWNSLFSYLIVRFADYFGLKRPCVFCSRVDHVIDRSKKASSYRDLLCDGHAAEVSKLGFCSSHKKIAESRDMCEDCSSSGEFSKEFAYFPWMKQIGKVRSGFEDKNMVGENDGVDLKCSCCGANVEKKLYSPCLLIKPDWGILDYSQKVKPIDENEIYETIPITCDRSGLDSVTDQVDDEQSNQYEGVSDHAEEGNSTEEVTKLSGIDEGIPIPCTVRSDSIHDEEKEEDRSDENRGVSESDGEKEDETEEEFSCFISSFDCNKETVDENEEAAARVNSTLEEDQEANNQSEFSVQVYDPQPCDKAETHALEAPNKHLEFVIDRQDCHLIPVEFYKSGDGDQGPCDNGDVILDFDVQVGTRVDFVVENRQYPKEEVTLFLLDPIKEEDGAEANEEMETDLHQNQAYSDDLLQMRNDETDAEISIGTEIPDYEQIEDFPAQELAPECSAQLLEDDGHGPRQDEDVWEFKAITCETKAHAVNAGFQQSLENDEEKVPDTPCSVDSLQSLHKGLILDDRKESGTEDSLDNVSITSEIECTDGVLTMEKLKSALKAERRALQDLYAELEEERSASAVAANQTMAMINRLQEEKAAMQMEALQYQRMMEEQSEYDQEALQLLNDLMVKKDRERAELEKELESYRKKIEEYEAKERTSMLRRRRTPSASHEDSDGLSVDLNQELKEEDKDKESFCNGQYASEHENTPAGSVLCLEESLADFEVERLSIIEQLKVLEEKLFTLNDEDNFEDVKPTENGNCHIEANGNGHLHPKELNGKHKLVNAKTLLPLFNAVDTETEDESSNGDFFENGFDSVSSKDTMFEKSGSESKRLYVEEEVDELYERLQALEADREFLKHCVGSLRKGDKGVYLLQEILQHLRDLRNVEVRARSMGDAALNNNIEQCI